MTITFFDKSIDLPIIMTQHSTPSDTLVPNKKIIKSGTRAQAHQWDLQVFGAYNTAIRPEMTAP